MGAPGFWDDPEAAAKVGAEHTRTAAAPRRVHEAARRRRRPRRASPSWRRTTPRWPRSSRRRSIPSSSPERGRGAAAVHRRLRRRRRARHRQRGRRRHRRPGLGGDGAADGDALGRAARIQGRAAGGERGRGGGDQVGDVPRLGRERLRALLGREGRAPARAAVAVRLRQPPPDVVRGRRGRAGGRGGGRGRDRGRRPAGRHLPRLGRRRPARQQDRLGGADHAQAVAGSSSSARTSVLSPPTARPRWRCCARS